MSRTFAYLWLLSISVVSFAQAPGSHYWELRREARKALESNDRPTALEKLVEADKLLPNNPAVIVNMARLSAALDKSEDAISLLRRLVQMQTYYDLAKVPELQKLEANSE